MDDALNHRFAKVEAMLSSLLRSVQPVCTFKEVKSLLGYKSNTAAYAWLKQHGLRRHGRGYERAQVLHKIFST